MRKILFILVCFFACCSLVACSAMTSSDESTEIQTQTTTQTQESLTSAPHTSAAREFVAFTCSGNDVFSFFPKFAGMLYSIDVDSNTIIKSNGEDEEVVMEFDEDLRGCISVGNALYIATEDFLYRLPVGENGGVAVDSITVVLDGESGIPAYCFDNEMVIRVYGIQDDSYILLDTQTGEYERIDWFNESISENILPTGSISSQQASSAALEMIQSEQFEGYFSRENYSAVSSVTAIHYPDFYYGISGTIWEFGNRSEYCYMVEIIADGEEIAPKFTVFVDASDGEILFISFKKS